MGGTRRAAVAVSLALLSGACTRVLGPRPPSAAKPSQEKEAPAPTPRGSVERAEERKRLLDITALSLIGYTDLLLRDTVNQPAKALELTENLRQTYPGIEEAANYPFVIYQRMHAAYLLSADEKADRSQAAKMLPVIEECWKTLKEAKDFKYLANACKMAALAHTTAARTLEELAGRAPSARARATLQKQARAARDRGLDLYIELLHIAPKQTFRTYRYVLYWLDRRVRERPTSMDRLKLAELYRKASALFGKEVKELHESLERLAPQP